MVPSVQPLYQVLFSILRAVLHIRMCIPKYSITHLGFAYFPRSPSHQQSHKIVLQIEIEVHSHVCRTGGV